MSETVRMTIDEIASVLAIGRYSVYRMLERGQLPGERIGHGGRGGRGMWMVSRVAFGRWLERCGETRRQAQ